MQLKTMDCTGRSTAAERNSDNMSHDDHSDDEMRDCDSGDGDPIDGIESRLNVSATSNCSEISVGEPPSGMHISRHHQFPTNHPLNALNNLMGMSGLHGLQGLQHNDMLEKLKLQVRDMNVSLMEKEQFIPKYGSNLLPTAMNTAFAAPPTSAGSFNPSLTAQAPSSAANSGGSSHLEARLSNSGGSIVSVPTTNAGFSFTSPTVPNSKEAASNSSTSSEASNSSLQTNAWSFEEQYKQVRQLYEINDDPKRKEFLDDLFSFMQKRGTPINRLPIMAKSVLDLYELYNLVIARGGLVDVINKKLWQEIIKGLHLPSSITSAAFTLRTQYMKYLYPYECEKKNLSNPSELQAAIDGNRREGRRSSYGQYETIHNQIQMPPLARQSLPGSMQQMSPLALVTHANNQQAQAAAAAAAAHHRLMAPGFGQVPNLVTQEIEQRMIEYLKLIQVKKEQQQQQQQQQAALANGVGGGGGGGAAMVLSPHHHQHTQQQQQLQLQQQQLQLRQRSPSPDMAEREALSALEMSRVALWQIYNNNTSPPASIHTSPQGGAMGNGNAIDCGVPDIQREALNLSDTPPASGIKRERDMESCSDMNEREDFHHLPPPAKRLGFPPGFYLPPGMGSMAAAAAAVNFHYKVGQQGHFEDEEHENESEHNTTGNSLQCEVTEHEHSSGGGGGGMRLSHHDSNHSAHHDKSDDSAIENSPSTSAASGGNGHISPVSSKKTHLSKQHQNNGGKAKAGEREGGPLMAGNALEALNLLSGMQFRVTRNGLNASGEQQLVVNLELNGIKYTGTLIANTNGNANGTDNDNRVCDSPAPNAIEGPCQEDAEMQDAPNTADEHNSSFHSINEGPVALCSDAAKEADLDVTSSSQPAEHNSDTPTRSKHLHAGASMTNGPTASPLKDTLITSS